MSQQIFELLTLLLTFLTLVHCEGDVVVCGGIIKSTTKIPFSEVKVGVFSTDGVLKESTECAPHNGYFLLPLYSKGKVSVRVLPPPGWTFSPSEIPLDIDGVSDPCSRGEDLNFVFEGFTVSGSVVSKGLEVGPTGVSVSLADEQGTQHVKTVSGSFAVSKVLSGVYSISLSHPNWRMENPISSITVGVENHHIILPFVVISYDVRGSVQSEGQPIAGVEFYLKPLTPQANDVIEGCEIVKSERGVCKVVSDTSGTYFLPSLAPGSYQITPHYQSEHSTFDVSPNQLTFDVISDTVLLNEAFTVNGFAVIGVVLDAVENGNPLPGVNIFVNGEKVSVTDTEGQFELSNVTSGKYEVTPKLRGFYFNPQILDISPNNPILPDISANAYQLCGTVYMTAPPPSALLPGQRKVGLRPSGSEESNAELVPTSTDATGAFCFKVSPGSYTLESLIGAQEYRDGLRLLPEKVEVEITNSPRHNVEFHQGLATLRGSVLCISGDCNDVKIQVVGDRTAGDALTLNPLDVVEAVATGPSVATGTVTDGVWQLPALLPGEYKVTVDYAEWCWKETEQMVVVEEEAEVPAFEQSGYIMKLEVSHPAQLNFSVNSEVEGATTGYGTFSLEKGTNRFCLKKPGVYSLVPYACHKFEHEKYEFDTSQVKILTLSATHHLLKGVMRLAQTDSEVQVSLTNMGSHEKVLLDITPTGEEDGVVVYSYQMWSLPDQKYLIKPVSESLLFTPVSQTTHVSDEMCPTIVPTFSGHPGTFVSGSVTPPVRGVLITLTSPDTTDLTLTQITDDSGAYSIGPLHNNFKYHVSASKVDYDIVRGVENEHDFVAVKLSKLTVIIKKGDTLLPGTLVSVSSSKGYRNNVVLENSPLVLTGLVPGDYYIRPIMKEYQFTPSSKMLTITEGLEVTLEMIAERVSFSCYGRVTTLNGTPQPDVVIEATGTGDCALLEEGISGTEGDFRIRGLTPNCPITVAVRTDKSNNVRRASPSSKVVMVSDVDSTNINFLIFHEPTTFDITGYVQIPDEFILSTKVILIDDSRAAGKKVHSSQLDQSRLFIFPEMDLSHVYTLQLESALSPSMFNFKIPDIKIKSEAPFQHIETTFEPTRKNIPQEQVTRASFTAVAVIVLSMVLAANHATLVPVFSQVYHSVVNRNNADLQSSHSSEASGMEYIDDVHRSGISRRGKSRKR